MAPTTPGSEGTLTSITRSPSVPYATKAWLPASATSTAPSLVTSETPTSTGAAGLETSITRSPDMPLATYAWLPAAAIPYTSSGRVTLPSSSGEPGADTSSTSTVVPLPTKAREPDTATALAGP